MARTEDNKKLAILQVLSESNRRLSSADIARALQQRGYDISARTVRFYIQRMQEARLVEGPIRGRRGGTKILPAGAQELQSASTVERVGFMQAKIDQLAYDMDFDINAGTGQVVLNITLLPTSHLRRALEEVERVYRAELTMGRVLTVLPPGARFGNYTVPEGWLGLGTVCSVTLNGIFLAAGVPTFSRFGGNLEVRDYEPVRFSELIAYEGSTVDPLDMFIRADLTQVREAAATGSGYIGASFREIPTSALPHIQKLTERLNTIGLGMKFFLGAPDQPFLDIPVPHNRTGIVVMGGLNPAAALEEAGIQTSNFALSTLCNFNDLISYDKAADMCQQKGLFTG